MKPEHLHEWSERIQGAKQLLLRLEGINLVPEVKGKDNKAYNQALRECLLDSYQMGKFLEGEGIEFYGHERNEKGILKVKAQCTE